MGFYDAEGSFTRLCSMTWRYMHLTNHLNGLRNVVVMRVFGDYRPARDDSSTALVFIISKCSSKSDSFEILIYLALIYSAPMQQVSRKSGWWFLYDSDNKWTPDRQTNTAENNPFAWYLEIQNCLRIGSQIQKWKEKVKENCPREILTASLALWIFLLVCLCLPCMTRHILLSILVSRQIEDTNFYHTCGYDTCPR